MSWIDKELRRREAAESQSHSSKSGLASGAQPQGEAERMAALWDRFEAANQSLPDKLKLRRDADPPRELLPNGPTFVVWLIASNGSGLGFTGHAIRYVWPEENRRNSRNFWIRWDAAKGYRLSRRVGWSISGVKTSERRFMEARIDRMIQCLVVGTRVDYKAVSRGRLWRFF